MFGVNIRSKLREMEFLAKKGQIVVVFGQKKANFEFSTKKRNGHFFTFIKPRPHEKNQKNLMRQFENMSNKTKA